MTRPETTSLSAGSPAAASPLRTSAWVTLPLGSSGGWVALTMIVPTGRSRRCSSRDRVGGLLDRHLLQQRHHVHRGDRRAQDRGHAVALGLDRPDLGQPGGLGGHVEEPADPAGRRRVQHHRVVDPVAVHGPGDRLLDLAGQQHVADAGRDRGGEVDRAELLQRPPGPAQLVEHVQVLQQGLLGVDREREHLAAAAGRGARVAGGDRPLLVRQRGPVEDPGDALALLHLDQQGAPAVRGQGQRQRGGDRRLAGTALAGHHV